LIGITLVVLGVALHHERAAAVPGSTTSAAQ
jgi:hypothetical protein